MKNKFLLAAVIAVSAFAACKKTQTPIPVVPPVTAVPTRAELTKDSIYLYAQQTYLWNVGMPTYAAFNPRSYASNQAIIDAIKALPGTNKPTDKYSFIDEGGVATAISGQSTGDYGFSVFYNGNPSNDLRVKYVYPLSPAALKGVTRGDRITKLNGRTDLTITGGTADANVTNAINDAIFGTTNNSVSMTLLKQDGQQVDVIVNRGSYAINPILAVKTFTVGAKKVGYIVFNSFTSNATPKLQEAFTTFASFGITEIIVDLRYDGGGSVQTAVDFTNLIAPASKTGQVMFTTYFNQTMQDGKADILKNQKFIGKDNSGVTRLFSYFDYDYRPTIDAGNIENFKKMGAVNGITRAYFLVSSNTASASELLINNLKPIMDVRLIGRTTYGKPVGFFAIQIDNLDMYIPQFQTKNQLGQGDYFNGMTVDQVVFDDVTKDFGDPTEKMLAYALNYAEKGNFTLSTFKLNQLISSLAPMSKMMEDKLVDELSQNEFKGMVDDRSRLKLKK